MERPLNNDRTGKSNIFDQTDGRGQLLPHSFLQCRNQWKHMWKPKRFDDTNALTDELIVKEQLNNISSFQFRRRRVLSGLLASALAFFLAFTMGEENEEWTILLIFPAMIFLVITAIMCRCPNCGAIPMGSSAAIGNDEVAYAKGLHLFPSRCKSCGYFLSRRALQHAVANANNSQLTK